LLIGVDGTMPSLQARAFAGQPFSIDPNDTLISFAGGTGVIGGPGSDSSIMDNVDDGVRAAVAMIFSSPAQVLTKSMVA
jgi:hypothetical protein